MTAKSEWLNGFEAGKKSVSGGYRHRIQKLEAKLDAVNDLTVHEACTPARIRFVYARDLYKAIGEQE